MRLEHKLVDNNHKIFLIIKELFNSIWTGFKLRAIILLKNNIIPFYRHG